ncbi:MAG: hypothetical protein V3R78_10290 [Thermodesulfobacteriota bacterium]
MDLTKPKYMKRVEFWDDERDIGNSLIVMLHTGWDFGTDPFNKEHVRGFDTIKEAKEAIRDAVPYKIEGE